MINCYPIPTHHHSLNFLVRIGHSWPLFLHSWQKIKNAIGWSGKNYLKLKNSLTKLVSTKIEWNIFKKDKKSKMDTEIFIGE